MKKRKREKNNGLVFSLLAVFLVFISMYLIIPKFYSLMKEKNFDEDITQFEQELIKSNDLNTFVNRYAQNNQCFVQIKTDTTTYQSLPNNFVKSKQYTGEVNHYQYTIQYSLDSVSELKQILAYILPSFGILMMACLTLISLLKKNIGQINFKQLKQQSENMLALDPQAKLTNEQGDVYSKEFINNINQLYQQLQFSILTIEKKIKDNADVEKQTLAILKDTSNELKIPINEIIKIINGMILNQGVYKNHQVYLIDARMKLEELKQTLSTSLEESLTRNKRELTHEVKLDQYFTSQTKTFELVALQKQVHIDVKIGPNLTIAVNDLLFTKAFSHMMCFILRQAKSQSNISITNNEYDIIIRYKGACLSNQSIETVLASDEDLKMFNTLLRSLQFYCDYTRTPKKDGMQFTFHF